MSAQQLLTTEVAWYPVWRNSTWYTPYFSHTRYEVTSTGHFWGYKVKNKESETWQSPETNSRLLAWVISAQPLSCVMDRGLTRKFKMDRTDEYLYYCWEDSIHIYNNGTKVWTHYNKSAKGAKVQWGPTYTTKHKGSNMKPIVHRGYSSAIR